ncbi:MAG: hypothetical protein IPJ13_17810 [Saprospiraceae bacterium]|nr:hypothetical protein [Saprospiraceae bacterium]
MNELKMYNPDLVDKPKILFITKCFDITDEEYLELVKPEIKVDIHVLLHIFCISKGRQSLKDALWKMMNE